MKCLFIACLAAIAVADRCWAAACDYSLSAPTDCVAKGYPNARIPSPDIWKELEAQLRLAQQTAVDSDRAAEKAIEAQGSMEEHCSGYFRHIRGLLPQCRDDQAAFAKLSAAAHVRELEANYALNKVIAETIAAYGLEPAAGISGQGGGRPPEDWHPRYSEKEIFDPTTGHWRREGTANAPNGEMGDDGRIAIFRAAIKPFAEKDLGSPDRVAAVILHETVHWVDRKAFDDRFWTHEAHRTEARAFRAEIDFVKRIERETHRVVMSDADVKILEGKYNHHKEAPGKIPNQDNWIGIPENYRIPRAYSRDGDGPEAETDASAELLKIQAGREFAASWDRRAASLLERIQQYNARRDEEERDRKEMESDVGRRLRAETALSRLQAFSARVCGNGEGISRVMVPLGEFEQIWAELGSTPSGSDPEPFLGLWDCSQWLSYKLDQLHAQGASLPTQTVLLELLQRHDEAVAKRVRGDSRPVAAPPPPKAMSWPPPAQQGQTRPPPAQGGAPIIPTDPNPPNRERCIYQGDWCR